MFTHSQINQVFLFFVDFSLITRIHFQNFEFFARYHLKLILLSSSLKFHNTLLTCAVIHALGSVAIYF